MNTPGIYDNHQTRQPEYDGNMRLLNKQRRCGQGPKRCVAFAVNFSFGVAMARVCHRRENECTSWGTTV